LHPFLAPLPLSHTPNTLQPMVKSILKNIKIIYIYIYIYIVLHIMFFEELVDNSRTDKNTTHSYLPLYEKLLKNKK